MLSRYEGRQIRVTTEDGEVFTGTAEAFPSGYGLHVFGVEEESVLLGDTHIFLSQIRRIDELPEKPQEPQLKNRCEAVVEALLDGPYLIADILPEQVPPQSEGQYFMVDRYFRRPVGLARLYRKHAEILLRLNCYYDMAVSFDGGESWELNPEPGVFSDRLAYLSGNEFLRAVFPSREAMIEIDPGDTYMTVFCREDAAIDKIRLLTAAEGLFLRRPKGGEA